jgi:hypothetical protein
MFDRIKMIADRTPSSVKDMLDGFDDPEYFKEVFKIKIHF